MAITEIRGVAVSIQEALSELRGNALTALAAASALRDSAIAADRDPATMDVAFAALASEVERAEAQKTAALEAELVVEDALLERAERVFGVVTTAARNASADELVAERPALLAQLDALFDALRSSPRGPVEEPTLLVVPLPTYPAPGDGGSDAASDPRLAMLVTRHVTAAELTLVLPRHRHVRPDSSVDVLLLLPLGVAPSLAQASLMQRVDAQATLLLSDALPVALAPRFSLYTGTTSDCSGVVVSFWVPVGTPVGSRVRIESVSVARELVGPDGHCNVCVSLHVGLAAPFRVAGAGRHYLTPCVLSDGRLAVPAPTGFHMYSNAGVLKQHQIDGSATCALAYIADGNTLITRGSDFVAAYDLDSESQGEPRLIWWHSGGRFGYGSVVALPEAGVVVFADHYGDRLVALHLRDGTFVQEVPLLSPIYAAAGPPGSCMIFVSSEYDGLIYCLQFDASDPARAAVRSPPLHPGRFGMPGSSPLAVMPPAPGTTTWHLIVGGYLTPLLVVLALPGGEEVGRIESSRVDPTGQQAGATESDPALFWGRNVKGLATDPAGGALVVVSDSDVFVVPWPPPTL